MLVVRVGSPIRGVFKNTSLYKKLEANKLKLPPPKNLPGRDKNVPYVFVVDEASYLSSNIMKPYGGSQEKGSIKRSFNYRLYRLSRSVVPNRGEFRPRGEFLYCLGGI